MSDRFASHCSGHSLPVSLSLCLSLSLSVSLSVPRVRLGPGHDQLTRAAPIEPLDQRPAPVPADLVNLPRYCLFISLMEPRQRAAARGLLSSDAHLSTSAGSPVTTLCARATGEHERAQLQVWDKEQLWNRVCAVIGHETEPETVRSGRDIELSRHCIQYQRKTERGFPFTGSRRSRELLEPGPRPTVRLLD